MRYPATLLCDFYKVSHKEQYPKGIEASYSTWTPRSNKYAYGIDKVVAFGTQYFVKEYLINYFNEMFFNRPLEDVVSEYSRIIKYALGVDKPDTSHIEALHSLGYLPIKIRAVKEGLLAPMKTPMMTIENTNSDFFWLPGYLESLLSSELWLPMTSASIATEYYRIASHYADMTVGNRDHVPFQMHDFSFRGMEGLNAAASSGAGHLLPFVGSDSIPSILFHEKYYGANIEDEIIGVSIPATEHSVMCANSDPDSRDEFDNFKKLITETYPEGPVSIVSDTYDFWNIIGEVIPKLKDDIMNRNGKVIIRPDSGDPVDILCGRYIEDFTVDVDIEDLEDYMVDVVRDRVIEETPHGEHGEDGYLIVKHGEKYYEIEVEFFWNRYDKQYYYIDGVESVKFKEFTPDLSDLGLVEALWNIFGGTINEKGYKVLDEHIRAIYGDSITLDRARQIFKGLEAKGFASNNVVLGVGSYTYQYNTRDTFGFAMKATAAQINGVEKELFKDPKTDIGKRSQRGRVSVFNTNEGIIFHDGLSLNEEYDNISKDMLETIFEDGQLKREQSLSDIRKLLFTQI